MAATLLQTLDELKDKGFSPSDRAIVAHEWMKWAVHFHGPRPAEHFTHHHQRAQTIFELFQESVSQLQKPSQLQMADPPTGQLPSLGSLMRNNIAQAFDLPTHTLGWSQDIQAKTNLIKSHSVEISSTRFSNASLNDWLDVLTGSSISMWSTIKEMEMDEDDLQVYLERKMPQPSQQFPAPSDLTLEQSYVLLNEALSRAQIPVCALDEFSANSSSTCYALSQHLNRMCDAFEHLGVSAPGLGAVHMRVDYPYAEGYSGVMDSYQEASPDMPLATPVIAVSNQCGWEYEEVIIHELLHAHDALLSHAAQEDYKSGRLLSDITDSPSPLWTAWQKLAANIDGVQSHHDIQEKKQLARQGVTQRWSSMGIPADRLEEAIHHWETNPSGNKDLQLHDQVSGLFENTPFAASAAFRANVIVAECKLLEKMDQNPVFRTFVQEFDHLHVQEVNKDQAYGRGYFEDLAEKMARSIQSSLDVLPSSSQVSNPYAKRWLVYADQSLSQDISKCWQKFFQTPCVQEAYDMMRTAAPDLSNIKSRVLAIRQRNADSNNSIRRDDFKKAAL